MPISAISKALASVAADAEAKRARPNEKTQIPVTRHLSAREEDMRSNYSMAALAGLAFLACSSQADAAGAPYQVEWVYHVKYGHQDEWWKIFRKYQIAILDREKQLGFVTDYYVDRPGLHTSEDARWDYRIIITYPNYEASKHEGEVQHQLFPDTAGLTREENRRWELTVNHWDLPIHRIDPHGSDD